MSAIWSTFASGESRELRREARDEALRSWRRSPGRAPMEAAAKALLAPYLHDVFGRWCLQYGAAGHSLIESADTLRSVSATPQADPDAGLLFDGEHMPLFSGSMDAVVLVFALEFSASPHALLREACRVLSDRGVLLVIGQSPHGIGSWPRLAGLSGRGLPGGAKLLRPSRLRDWMTLLDLELTGHTGFAAGWPWRGEASSMIGRLLSDCYLLQAHKRVIPPTRVQRPAVMKHKTRVPGGVAVGNFRKGNGVESR